MQQSDQAAMLGIKIKSFFSESYAGVYFDAKDGKTHIQLSKNEDVLSFVRKEAIFPEDVIIDYVEYSESELLGQQKLLEFEMSSNLNIVCWRHIGNRIKFLSLYGTKFLTSDDNNNIYYAGCYIQK